MTHLRQILLISFNIIIDFDRCLFHTQKFVPAALFVSLFFILSFFFLSLQPIHVPIHTITWVHMLLNILFFAHKKHKTWHKKYINSVQKKNPCIRIRILSATFFEKKRELTSFYHDFFVLLFNLKKGGMLSNFFLFLEIKFLRIQGTCMLYMKP